MNFLNYYLFTETSTVQELLTDPANDDVSFNSILHSFKDHGGKLLGIGAYGKALWHPNWNYVLKIFEEDIAYLRFVRFVIQNPRPSFPKFLDKPRKIIPRFKRHVTAEHLYLVRMEMLKPLDKYDYDNIVQTAKYLHVESLTLNKMLHDNKANDEEKAHSKNKYSPIYSEYSIEIQQQRVDQLKQQVDALDEKGEQFVKDYMFLMTNLKNAGIHDLHDENVMQRSNGEIVITDPFAAGHGGEKARRLQSIKRSRINTAIDNNQLSMFINGGKKVRYPAPAPVPPPEPQQEYDPLPEPNLNFTGGSPTPKPRQQMRPAKKKTFGGII